MTTKTDDIILNNDGDLADCLARRKINRIWSHWPDPEILQIELKPLFAEHPAWESNPAVQKYIIRLINPPIAGLPQEENGYHAIIKNLAEVEAETVHWLWHPYIPFGKLTLVEGDPGVGKSWLCLAIITAVSLGHGLIGQSELAYGPCLIASAEDGLADTIKPRLSAMGANDSVVRAVDGLFTLTEEGFTWLENEILNYLPILVVIDPLVAFLSADMDINKANQVRFATARLAKLADKYSIAVVAVRHLTKGGSSKPIYRGLGSIDFTAAARSVLLAGQDPDIPQIRGFVHIKSNLSAPGAAVGYELRDGGFYWLDHSDLTSERILQSSNDGAISSMAEAKDFIQDMLSTGPISANELFSEAKRMELSSTTLNRAKRELGIVTYRDGEKGKKGGGKWLWKMPEISANSDN